MDTAIYRVLCFGCLMVFGYTGCPGITNFDRACIKYAKENKEKILTILEEQE
jgi:hypothetical protein